MASEAIDTGSTPVGRTSLRSKRSKERRLSRRRHTSFFEYAQADCLYRFETTAWQASLFRSKERRLSRRRHTSFFEYAQADCLYEVNVSFSHRLRPGRPAMNGFFYVYILRSETEDHYYVGRTKDLKSRLQKHNQGGCVHTAQFAPWFIETSIAFRSEEKAIAFEKYLKSGSGREFSRRHF